MPNNFEICQSSFSRVYYLNVKIKEIWRKMENWYFKKNSRRPRKIRERKERDPGPFFVPICYSTSENSTGIIMVHDHRSIDRSVIGERISRRNGSRGSAFKTSFFHVLVHAGLHAIGQQHVARDFIAAEHESVSHCVRVYVCGRGKETRRSRPIAQNA